MYNGLFTACDACAKPLEGKVGTARVKLNHIILKGNMALVEYSEEHPDGYTYYAKRRDDISTLAFCNEECILNFLEARKEIILQRNNSKDEYNWN